MTADLSQSPSWVTYYGFSMMRVFVPGDRLKLDPVSIQELCPGDIVSVMSAEVPYCHRVIANDGKTVTTQGDNNEFADRHLIDETDEIYRVSQALTFHGKPRAFHSGEAGMRDFRIHQRHRAFRLFVSRRFSWLERLLFWRIMPKDCRQFGAVSCWYWHGYPVIRRTGKGALVYSHFWLRFFFRRPVLPYEGTGKQSSLS